MIIILHSVIYVKKKGSELRILVDSTTLSKDGSASLYRTLHIFLEWPTHSVFHSQASLGQIGRRFI